MLNHRQTAYLLEELCVKFGFCLPPEANERVLSETPADAESFARAVFAAEGVDPEPSHRRLYREVLDHIQAAYRRAEKGASSENV